MLPKMTSTVHTHKTLDGKTIHFRQFKSGDEQTLLEAKESKDGELIINTVLNVIQSTIVNGVKIRELPSFEIESLLLKSRIVSVGGQVPVGMKCSCGQINNVEVDLTKATLSEAPKDKKVFIGKEAGGQDVFVVMKYPTFSDLDVMKSKNLKNLIRTCIESIVVGESYNDISAISDEDLDSWFMDLEKDKIQKVYDFISSMPKLSLDIKYVCKCGKDNEFRLEGFEDFFT